MHFTYITLFIPLQDFYIDIIIIQLFRLKNEDLIM